MMETSNHKMCELCGDKCYEKTFGFTICRACELYTFQCLKSKTVHDPCRRNKKCISSLATDIKACPCCFLEKCAIHNFDPYNTTRQEIQRRSFPYYPCPTCTRNTFTARNRRGYENSLQCEVCEGLIRGVRYSAPVCQACASFFRTQAVAKTEHRQCKFNQQCIITKENRRKSCTCCRLKKCLAVGMDPVEVTTATKVKINYNSIDDIEPEEWFVLLPCGTCDSEKISKVNRDIQYLKNFFMILKEKRTISSVASIKEPTDDAVKRRSEKDNVNCLKPSDSVPTHSISDDTLIEMNLYFEDPVLLLNDAIGNISNRPYSGGESGGLGISGSSQLPTTVENHDPSYLQVLSTENSDVFLSGFPVEAMKEQRLNLSSTSALSLCPSPGVCEGISPIDISDESAIEETYTDDGGIDTILFEDLIE